MPIYRGILDVLSTYIFHNLIFDYNKLINIFWKQYYMNSEIQTGDEINKQYEMPFAIVEGEPVTELPQDLYIPPFALKVFLEAFEGPLDLLLYLIRRQNLDILDIPITAITQQYIDYINLMEEI